MKRLRRPFLHLAAGAAVLGILSVAPTLHEAQAQSGRTVRAIVPTPPAGVNDLMARLMGDYLGKTHGLSDGGREPRGRGRGDRHRSRGARRARRQHGAVRVVAGRHQPAAAEGELPSAGKLRADLPARGGAVGLFGPSLVALPHAQRPARRSASEARQRDDGKPRPRNAVRHRACDAQERNQGGHHLRAIQRQRSVDQRAFGRTRDLDVQQLLQHLRPAQSRHGCAPLPPPARRGSRRCRTCRP